MAVLTSAITGYSRHAMRCAKMIKSKSDKPVQEKVELDLTGPQGNSYYLLGVAKRLGEQLGYSDKRIKAIQHVMCLSNYEGLVHTFHEEFGDYVIIWR